MKHTKLRQKKTTADQLIYNVLQSAIICTYICTCIWTYLDINQISPLAEILPEGKNHVASSSRAPPPKTGGDLGEIANDLAVLHALPMNLAELLREIS